MTAPAYRYRALCLRVVDGDTYLLDIDLGFGVHSQQMIRLRGVNCPEANTDEGKAARTFVVELIGRAVPLVVETYKDRRTFARWVADVWVGDDPLKDLIIAAGHGTAI